MTLMCSDVGHMVAVQLFGVVLWTLKFHLLWQLLAVFAQCHLKTMINFFVSVNICHMCQTTAYITSYVCCGLTLLALQNFNINYVDGRHISYITEHSHLGPVISADTNDKHDILNRKNGSVVNWITRCVTFASVIHLLNQSCCVTFVAISMAAVYGIYLTAALPISLQPGVRAWGDCGVFHTRHTVYCWHPCLVCCHLSLNLCVAVQILCTNVWAVVMNWKTL